MNPQQQEHNERHEDQMRRDPSNVDQTDVSSEGRGDPPMRQADPSEVNETTVEPLSRRRRPKAGRPIISVRNLTVQFGDNLVLEDISFDVHEGEILVILGESGCGKSTLMRHMLALQIPNSGEVTYEGKNLFQVSERELDEIRRSFGVLFQSGALFKSQTLGENVATPAVEFTDLSDDTIDELVRLKLEMVGLGGKENLMPSELSGGMQKRGGLARAMVLDPTVLFFDEPSAGLDPITSASLDHLILTLSEALQTTMVVVTHELQSIFTIADRCIMLGKNTPGVLAIGTPEQLRDESDHPRVRAFFHRERVAEENE